MNPRTTRNTGNAAPDLSSSRSCVESIVRGGSLSRPGPQARNGRLPDASLYTDRNGAFFKVWGNALNSVGDRGGREARPVTTIRRTPDRLSLAGCTPAEPASVSPAGRDYRPPAAEIKLAGQPRPNRAVGLPAPGITRRDDRTDDRSPKRKARSEEACQSGGLRYIVVYQLKPSQRLSLQTQPVVLGSVYPIAHVADKLYPAGFRYNRDAE